MNIFKSLIGKVWRPGSQCRRGRQDSRRSTLPCSPRSVSHCKRGYNLNSTGNIRTSGNACGYFRAMDMHQAECGTSRYNDAMATIRRVSAVEHHFQLVITRVYEEGDQELLEDEDETDEEKTFLIAEELEFRTGETDGEPHFIWRDLQGDVDEFYEYVAVGTNAPTRAFFETACTEPCMSASIRLAQTISAIRIWRSLYSSVPPIVNPPVRRKKVAAPQETVVASAPVAPAAVSALADFPVLIEKEAALFFWDSDIAEFVEHGQVVARILRGESFESWLTASNEDGQLLAHKIRTEMNQRWTSKMRSFTWNHMGDDGNMTSWVMRFGSLEDYEPFLQTFTQALWETLYQTAWAKAKPDEQSYVMSANEDVDMPDVSDDEEDEDQIHSELGADEPSDSEDEETEEEEEDDEDNPRPADGEHNSQLTVGYKGDRSYVVRGSKIGFFTRGSDFNMKYGGTIDKLTTPKGKEFRPSKVMLHDQDTKMVLKNPLDPHSLYSLDLERGKIVEEWKVHDDIQVDHIAPESKFAPTTQEQTLVGASHNALFRIDPRVSGTKMVESQFKQYVAKNKFSGVATTKDGKLAVSSEKGDLRLFDSIGKNAKTALPPLGDPILGVDVTADGRYIVATTKTYLLLIDTLIGEGRYAGSLGFDRSFPANAKPIPRRLQLRAEHVAYMNHDISFSPARFNQSETDSENTIVTSTGQFVIAWDFSKVKKGLLDKYEIKKYEDMVIQDNFRFGDDKEIIVALKNNVVAVNKQHLKRPTRASLGVPRRVSQSHSGIVNAPY
ncbi:unnamed protein product [Mycena citricolor]|uniref:Vacuolar import and degradation protein n=1 Tax=Mycena citricolor TaxID=2018698 RepID=A0AAD2GU64_9AGAR|nr:unnamed protein product [Mycena citricolor]